MADKPTRTDLTLKNAAYAVGGQLGTLVLTFALRGYFLYALGAELLGVHSLLTSIVTVLSFFDLGIGTAIVYSLYRPIALGREERILALMRLMRSAFLIIAASIFVLGVLATPFLGRIVKDLDNVAHAELYFGLFVANTCLTYLLSFRKLFLQAAQKAYLIAQAHFTVVVIVSIIQFGALFFWRSYSLYILVMIAGTVLENLWLNKRALREYPALRSLGTAERVDGETASYLKRNIAALVFHKIGSVVVLGGMSILIGRFAGLVQLGIFAGYQMLVTALHSVLGQIFRSAVASIGNLHVLASREARYVVFLRLDYLCLWVYVVATSGFVALSSPFVDVWLGERMRLDYVSVLALAMLLYFTGRRRSVQAFKDAAGLYWEDRWKPVAEAVLFLGFGFLLGPPLGVVGVVAAGLLSTLATSFWIEPWVMFKHALQMPLRKYMVRFGWTTILAGITVYLSWLAVNLVPGSGWGSLTIKTCVSLVSSNGVFLLLTWRMRERAYVFGLVATVMRRRR